MSTPKILYTLVAYNGVVLVDYSKSKGDFINETRDYVFPKLKDKGRLTRSFCVHLSQVLLCVQQRRAGANRHGPFGGEIQ